MICLILYLWSPEDCDSPAVRHLYHSTVQKLRRSTTKHRSAVSRIPSLMAFLDAGVNCEEANDGDDFSFAVLKLETGSLDKPLRALLLYKRKQKGTGFEGKDRGNAIIQYFPVDRNNSTGSDVRWAALVYDLNRCHCDVQGFIVKPISA